MIRMTSGLKSSGIGRSMLEQQYEKDGAGKDDKNIGVGKLLQDRYNTNKTPNNVAGIEKLLMDRFEKTKENAAAAYTSYTATGAKRSFGGYGDGYFRNAHALKH